MTPSKYLKAFQAAGLDEGVVLTGDFLIVEKVDLEIKSKSGIVIAQDVRHKGADTISANLPTFVHVLKVGAGYVAEDGSDSPLDTQPGDILLVGQASVKWLPVFGTDNYEAFTIGITREAETQLRFRGIEAYQRYFENLNRASEKTME
jgi:co-chaperonin GroES (HSP10)